RSVERREDLPELARSGGDVVVQRLPGNGQGWILLRVERLKRDDARPRDSLPLNDRAEPVLDGTFELRLDIAARGDRRDALLDREADDHAARGHVAIELPAEPDLRHLSDDDASQLDVRSLRQSLDVAQDVGLEAVRGLERAPDAEE